MNQYEPLDTIGSGSFGVIRKVKRKSDGMILARKEIDYRRMNEKEKIQLVAEVNILRELNHPNIVRYYERFVDRKNSQIYMIIEYCEGGDLAGVIKRCKNERRFIPEDVIWNIFTQLLQALSYCHLESVLHRDIKPENAFLDKNLNVKLGDFGLSRSLDIKERFAKTFVGTPYYMSPELIDDTKYNEKSDIWALACLIYELCALEYFDPAKSHGELVNKIKEGKIHPLPAHYSKDLEHALCTMFTLNPDKRPDASSILQHPRIKTSIREQEFNIQKEKQRRMEDELTRWSKKLDAKEAELRTWEDQLKVKAEQLFAMEEQLSQGAKENERDITMLGPSPSPRHSSRSVENMLSVMAISPLISKSNGKAMEKIISIVTETLKEYNKADRVEKTANPSPNPLVEKLCRDYRLDMNCRLFKEHQPKNYLELRMAQNKKWAFQQTVEGIEMFKKGEISAASEKYNKAIQLDSECIEAYVARGCSYANEKKFSLAIEDLEMALELNPEHLNAKKYLEAIYEKKKKKGKKRKKDEEIIRNGEYLLTLDLKKVKGAN